MTDNKSGEILIIEDDKDINESACDSALKSRI